MTDRIVRAVLSVPPSATPATQVRRECHQLPHKCVANTTKSYAWHSVVCDNVCVCVTMLCGTELCACVSQFGVSQRSSGGGGGGGADGVQKAKNTKPTQCRELYHYLYHYHSHYQSLSHVNQTAKQTQLTKSCDIYDAIHTDLATLVKSIPVLRRLPRRSLFVPTSPLWLFDIADPAFVETVRLPHNFQWGHPDYPTWYGANTTIEPIFHQAAVLRLTVHHFTITRELSATICLPGSRRQTQRITRFPAFGVMEVTQGKQAFLQVFPSSNTMKNSWELLNLWCNSGMIAI